MPKKKTTWLERRVKLEQLTSILENEEMTERNNLHFINSNVAQVVSHLDDSQSLVILFQKSVSWARDERVEVNLSAKDRNQEEIGLVNLETHPKCLQPCLCLPIWRHHERTSKLARLVVQHLSSSIRSNTKRLAPCMCGCPRLPTFPCRHGQEGTLLLVLLFCGLCLLCLLSSPFAINLRYIQLEFSFILGTENTDEGRDAWDHFPVQRDFFCFRQTALWPSSSFQCLNQKRVFLEEAKCRLFIEGHQRVIPDCIPDHLRN